METMLAMLKVDLGIMTTTIYDERLKEYLASAQTQIEREGAVLDLDVIDDMQGVVMYAAWMWRRRESGEGMPRMVRYWLNNKILGAKMGAKMRD